MGMKLMDIFSVTNGIDGETGLIQLPLSDIAYMEFERAVNRVLVHTPNQIYYVMGTLQYWQKAIEAAGHRFLWVDRTYVVNIDRIRYMDPVRHIAYFEETPTKESKSCTLTNIRFGEILNKLGAIQNAPGIV